MSTRIILKHLARQFQLDTYPIRHLLRSNNFTTNNGRYSWQANDPELDRARQLIRERLLPGTLSSGSQAFTTPTPTNSIPSRHASGSHTNPKMGAGTLQQHAKTTRAKSQK